MESAVGLGVQKYAADITSIREAYERIKQYIHKTPVLTSASLDSMSGKNLFFKAECFQKSGAFKLRGASNAVMLLDEQNAANGVVTHSSGNHAAAVALAAKLRGIPAYIILPENAPKCKFENVKRFGGSVIWSEPNMPRREKIASEVVKETGAVLVHSIDNPDVISGQGTISLELLEQIPELDTIIVPISGGSLISGVALAAKAIKPSIRVLGVEPIGANDVAQSKIAGQRITLSEVNTMADALRAPSIGNLTWPIVRDLVDDVITLEDSEIVEAMRLCFEVLKIVVEPSAAIGLAAVLSKSFQTNPAWTDCKNIGLILTGGNVDMGVLWDSLRR